MEQQTTKKANEINLRQRKILIIDDEAAFTRLLKINLEALGGYAVHVENDPRLALPAALRFHPDLILLDVMMPGLDGGDVLNRLRSQAELGQTPVIFLTATVNRVEVDEHDGNFGGQRFIAKPVDLPKLLECIEEVFAD